MRERRREGARLGRNDVGSFRQILMLTLYILLTMLYTIDHHL